MSEERAANEAEVESQLDQQARDREAQYPELRTRDGFTIDSVFMDRFDDEMAVILGDGTAIYHDTPVAPRDEWLAEPADLPSSALPIFRVYVTLKGDDNVPVESAIGPSSMDLFSLSQSMMSALAYATMEGTTGGVRVRLLKVEVRREG